MVGEQSSWRAVDTVNEKGRFESAAFSSTLYPVFRSGVGAPNCAR